MQDIDSARARVEEIRSEIERANRAYYLEGEPIMPDSQWDALFDELARLEEAYPALVTPDSPTQRVGPRQPVAPEFRPVKHSIPMLSLGKADTESEVREWDARVRKNLGAGADLLYACEPKYDGLSVELVYRGGRLETGSTRGDGFVGEDVTPNILTLRGIPARLTTASPPALLEVRGEVYMPVEAFQRLNQALLAEGKPVFSNPRNSAAGSLRQKDPEITRSRQLEFFAHGLGRAEGIQVRSHQEGLEVLRRLGLPTTEVRVVRSIEELAGFYQDLLSRREKLPYEMDGIVIKVNDLRLQEELGWVSRSPRWALAWKFPPVQRKSRILRIIPSVGRTGAITPFADLEPVVLSGARVKQASLFNLDYIRRKDIREGDAALVQRGGEVIPYVVKVYPEERPPEGLPEWKLPEECPACGARIERPEGEAVAYCTGARCPVQMVQRIFHFGSRGAMDIGGLGEKTIEALVNAGWVADVGDIFYLQRERLLELERMGEKSVENLLSAIRRAKDRPLWKLIYGLGIRHVGETVAQLLSRGFHRLDDLAAAGEEELAKVHGIGPVVAKSVATFFRNPDTRVVIEKLRAAGVRLEEEAGPAGPRPLEGKTLVLTGGFEGYTREGLKSLLESLGAKVASSVSKKTDYVIAGADPGTKLARAQELSRPVLDQAGLTRLLEEARAQAAQGTQAAQGPDADSREVPGV
jgi:DNA ligase (NAD+)